ncbi:unnamed protein product [marine sediment metagenome]|uniref:Uncharacterized protein n=1 Tax=marine sediment metagenome TaxID=412755 RepID=X0VCZ6_9ZZZZ
MKAIKETSKTGRWSGRKYFEGSVYQSKLTTDGIVCIHVSTGNDQEIVRLTMTIKELAKILTAKMIEKACGVES